LFVNSGTNDGVLAGTINDGVHMHYGDTVKRIPTILPKFIEILAVGSRKSKAQPVEDFMAYEIEEKIEYNQILIYEEIINEHYPYYYICEIAFTSMEEIEMYTKRNILHDVNTFYKNVKKDFLIKKKSEGFHITASNMKELLFENADEILDTVKNRLLIRIQDGYESEEFTQEELDLCLNIFISYSFGECKILEKVPKKK